MIFINEFMKATRQKTKLYKPEIQGEEDFYNSINKAIKTSEHKDALMDIVKEYEIYKKCIQENIVASIIPSNKIFKFKFTYQLKKNVWKDIEIFGEQTLEELAEYIIDEMGWDNDHLHAFFFPRKESDGLRYWYNLFEIGSDGVDNDQYPILHSNEVLVSSLVYLKHPKIGFVFDFGDDHRFMMEYKGMRKASGIDEKISFPRITDQQGVGPEQYPDYLNE